MNNNEPSLQKNYWIAFLLSIIVLIGYPYFLKKINPNWGVRPAAEEVAPQTADSIVPSDLSATPQALAPAEGPFLEKTSSPAIVHFQNRFYRVQFSTLGASVVDLFYNGVHHKRKVTETSFYEGDANRPGLFTVRIPQQGLDLSSTVFKLNRRGRKNEIFEFVFEKPDDYRLYKTFTFQSDKPVFAMDVTVENLSDREAHFPLEIIYGLDHPFSDARTEQSFEAVVAQEKIHSANAGKIAKKGFVITGDAEWAGLLKKYFALLVKPDAAVIQNEAKSSDGTIWATMQLQPLSVPAGQRATRQFFIFAGPQQYELLKSFDANFDAVLSRGFFGLFKIWLLIALKFLEQYVHNYGWAIILLTILLKGAFAPLTHMSFESMKKMQAIQPKLKSLQERYKNDPAKLNREMMELYKRNKVNPMGGCLPMLLQIPIFIAFYQVLSETIELKGAPFIYWINDLSEPDRLFNFGFSIPFVGDSFHLLPLLMIVSMIWQQKLTPQVGATPEQTKIMAFSPIIFGFLFYKMPSGLVLYWFVNNVLSIIHQIFVKRMVIVLHHEDRD